MLLFSIFNNLRFEFRFLIFVWLKYGFGDFSFERSLKFGSGRFYFSPFVQILI